MRGNVTASGNANWSPESYFAQSGASQEQVNNELRINKILDDLAPLAAASHAEGSTLSDNGELKQQETALKSQLEKLLDTRLTAPEARRKYFSKAMLWLPSTVASRATNVGLSLLGVDKRIKTANLSRGFLHALDETRRKLRLPISAQRKIISKWCVALGLNAHSGRMMLGETASKHFAKFLYDLHTHNTYGKQPISDKQLQQLRDVITAIANDQSGELTAGIFKIAKGSVFGPNAEGKLQQMVEHMEKLNTALAPAKKPATAARNNIPVDNQPDKKREVQGSNPTATNKPYQQATKSAKVLGTVNILPLSTSQKDNVKAGIFHEKQVGLECAIHSINNLFGKRVFDRKAAEAFLKKKETIEKIFVRLGGIPDELKKDMHQYTSFADGLDVSSFPILLEEAIKKQGVGRKKPREISGDEVSAFIKNWQGDHLVIHTATNSKKLLTNPHYLVFKKRQDSSTGEPRWFKQDSLDPNPVAQTPTEYLHELSGLNKKVTHAWHMTA